jgi:hypothetical protein
MARAPVSKTPLHCSFSSALITYRLKNQRFAVEIQASRAAPYCPILSSSLANALAKPEDRGARQYIRVPAAALPVERAGILQRNERKPPQIIFWLLQAKNYWRPRQCPGTPRPT